MRQKTPFNASLFIIFLIAFFNSTNLKADSSPTVKKVNGEEVYIPKDENKSANNKEPKLLILPAEKNLNKKSHETDKKDNKGTMLNSHSESEKSASEMKDHEHQEKSENKETMSHAKTNEHEKTQSNKLTQYDEEPFDVYRPQGYIWFAAVFVILLFVIFVFT